MSKKIIERVFSPAEQAVQLALEGLCKDRWISTSVLAMALYDNARYDVPRYFGKSQVVRCELVNGQKLVVVLHTTTCGKEDAKKRKEKLPEWYPNGVVIEFEGKPISLAQYKIGLATQWTKSIDGHNFIYLFHTEQASQRDREYLGISSSWI